MKHLLHNWKNLAKKATNAQMSVVLIIIYFIFIVPLSIIFRVVFKNIFIRFSNQQATSFWQKKVQHKQDIHWAEKQ
jgi:flagellar basal body-associated protein FliL